jgi:phosphoribosylglycinamide formyltransferase-1
MLNISQAIERGELDAEIVLVISSRRTAQGVERAEALGLPVEVLRPRDFPDRAAFCAAQTARLDDARADLVLMAGYLVHFPVPAGYAGRILNIHPSLLPRHGGQGMYGDRVHAAVLAAGDTESGCTVHVVNDDYDQGPVVLQARVPVHTDDTPESLGARVFEAECEAYPAALRLHLASREAGQA